MIKERMREKGSTSPGFSVHLTVSVWPMACPGSWRHTWPWGQGTFLWRGFSAPNTGFLLSM